MLINSYIVICITLICLSSHACHARPLGNRLLSKKSDQMRQRLSLSEKVEVADDKEITVKVSINKDEEYTYNKQMKEEMQIQRLTKTTSDHDHTQANDHHQAVVTVTWHVPHKNTIRHPQPRFNLDYEPPQTHPPSHN